MRTSEGKTSFQIAREALDKAGLNDVQVKKAGFFRALFFGNSYSVRKKTIFLRGGIADKDSITAVGLALQKVGIAKMCADGSKMVRTRNTAQVLSIVGPILFVPVVLVGFLVDILLFSTLGTFSVVGIVVGLVLVVFGFISTLLNLPVEKRQTILRYKLFKKLEC